MAEASVRPHNTGIYEIVNTVNGKRYVGSACSFHERWKLHRIHLRRGTHHSPHLQASWDKHGEAAFKFNRLLICSRQNLIMYEQAAMDALLPEFNVLKVAGSCLGHKHSAETRAKVSAAKMGNTATLGFKHSAETRAMQSAIHKGRPSPMKGRQRKPEAVAATAAAHRGMERSEETKSKIAAKAVGRKRSPESIEKGAEKRRGVPLSPEHRAKLLGNTHAVGWHHTDEWKAAASARKKGIPVPKDAEWRAKIGASLRGRTIPDEVRAKISLTATGKKRGPYKPMSEETRLRSKALRAGQSNPMSGKTHSESARAKMSVANKGRKCSPERAAAVGEKARAMWADPVKRTEILQKRADARDRKKQFAGG